MRARASSSGSTTGPPSSGASTRGREQAALHGDEPLLGDQTVEEAVVPPPRPGEPALRLALGDDDRGADAGDNERPEVGLAVGLLDEDLVPACELAGVPVRLEDDAAREDGPAPLE